MISRRVLDRCCGWSFKNTNLYFVAKEDFAISLTVDRARSSTPPPHHHHKKSHPPHRKLPRLTSPSHHLFRRRHFLLRRTLPKEKETRMTNAKKIRLVPPPPFCARIHSMTPHRHCHLVVDNLKITSFIHLVECYRYVWILTEDWLSGFDGLVMRARCCELNWKCI